MATRETYIISGVCCSTEEAVLRRSLNHGLGMDQYRYNPTTCELQVPQEIAPERVLEQVRRAGFDARRSSMAAEDRSFWARHSAVVMAGAATVLTIGGIILEHLRVPPAITRGLFAAAMTVGGWRIAVKAFKAVRAATLDMNVLMTVAVLGAIVINRWAEGATVIVLFSVALMLESYSVRRTRRAIRSMLQLCPDQASVVSAQGERIVAAREVAPGMSVRIRPGERIPVDGEVTGGESSVSEAPITGEAEPVEKIPGDRVFAGSINAGGTLLVRATHAFEDTTLARIVHLIEEAHRARAPVQQAVDRFARVYTPVVMVLALTVAILPPLVGSGNIEEWVYRGLVLLVIACPCALVISTPVSIVSALTNAARRGILVKGGIHLETLARIQAIAFDKTGTLTEGKPRLTDIIPLAAISETELLRYAAALEERSEHTLARAVLLEAAMQDLSYSDLTPERFEATPGQGVRARINGAMVQVASPRALDSLPALSDDRTRSTLDRLAQEGKTTLVVVREDRVLGVLAARDSVRQRSRAVVEDLHGLGIRETVLLSGDRPASTARTAQETAVHRHQGELLPQEKLAAVEELKRRHRAVAMVGDGVNDAPALAAASVGIAMGGSGTDSAMETADVVLMGDAIERLPELLRLSRATMAIIGQNIALALLLKLVFLALSLAGEATLWMAVLADDGAALVVILNGLRLLGYASGRAAS